MYLMNSPILPNYGSYRMSGPVSLEEARNLLQNGFFSSIGHAATASLLSKLLGLDVPEQRVRIQFDLGDTALVFRLKTRLPEGFVVHDMEQLRHMAYEFSFLERVA